MDIGVQNMRPDEQTALRLRGLYESHGFQRVSLGKFEDYGLYIENKNFLQSDRIITFMDMNGKLLALKPDVTLSVIKNIPAKPLPTYQKVYYLDEVYRISRENREYQSRSQIGVELIGPNDVFANIEVVDLALLSLESIHPRYVLDISHLGFVSGLLDELNLPHSAERKVLSAIHSKSVHELGALLEDTGADEAARGRILALCGLHGRLRDALPRARALISGPATQAAYDELAMVAEALEYNGFAEHLRLDFSVVNDLDYYNGLIFRGYIEGLPHSILTGGRYDNLMKRMGKQCGATGFAVLLDELNTYIRMRRRYDFEMLITYGSDCNWAALLRAVKELTARNISVRLERSDADLSVADFTWKQHRRFEKDHFVREGECDEC